MMIKGKKGEQISRINIKDLFKLLIVTCVKTLAKLY